MNNPLKKYVRITTNLPKGIDEPVIGTLVSESDITVGKVIAYDKETGKAIIRIKSAVWEKLEAKQNCQKTYIMSRKTIEELKAKQREETVERWSKLGLLEGLEGNVKENAGKLFESQLSYIIDESGTTTQFSDVKFPIIHKAGDIEDPKQIIDD